MTTTTHPIASTHHVITFVITAAIAVGLTVALMLALTTQGSGTSVSRAAANAVPVITESRFAGTVNSRPDNPTRVVPTLCSEFAKASSGSPADFQLAQSITVGSSC